MVKNELEISMVEVADVHVISHLSNMIYSEQLLWAGNLKKTCIYELLLHVLFFVLLSGSFCKKTQTWIRKY